MKRLEVFGTAGKATTRAMIDAVLAGVPDDLRPQTAVVLSAAEGERGSRSAAALQGLGPDSIAVLSADHGAMPTSAGTVVTFGLTPGATVWADELDVSFEGTRFMLHTREGVLPVLLHLLGEHLATDALAAIAVGMACGVPVLGAVGTLQSMESAGSGRMERLERADGITIINDAAGAGPASASAALKTLAQLGVSRRSIAVLAALSADGGPEAAAAAHDRIGRLIVRLNVKKLVVVGYEARHIHNAAGLEGSWDGESVLVETADEAYDLLREVLQERDVVLVKSTREAGLANLAYRLGRGEP